MLWGHLLGGDDYDEAYGVAVGPDGTVVVTGTFRGEGSFGGAPLAGAEQGGNPLATAFAAAFSSSGEHLWSRAFLDYEYGMSAALTERGQAVIAGNSGTRGFIAVIDAQGQTVWTYSTPARYAGLDCAGDIIGVGPNWLGSYAIDDGTLRWEQRGSGGGAHSLIPGAFRADQHGGGVAAGTITGPVQLGDVEITGTGHVVLRFDATGKVLWWHVFPASGDWHQSVALGPDDAAYATGALTADTVIDGTPVAVQHYRDGYLAKFAP